MFVPATRPPRKRVSIEFLHVLDWVASAILEVLSVLKKGTDLKLMIRHFALKKIKTFEIIVSLHQRVEFFSLDWLEVLIEVDLEWLVLCFLRFRLISGVFLSCVFLSPTFLNQTKPGRRKVKVKSIFSSREQLSCRISEIRNTRDYEDAESEP